MLDYNKKFRKFWGINHDNYASHEKLFFPELEDILTYYLIDTHAKTSSFNPFTLLFTSQKDIVDFNKLDWLDYSPGSQYNALTGDDIVVLPLTIDKDLKSGFDPYHDFHGGNGNDVIIGVKITDHIYGDFGDDDLNGGEGNDTILAEKTTMISSVAQEMILFMRTQMQINYFQRSPNLSVMTH